MPLRRPIAAIAVVAAGVCLSAGISATPAGAAEGQGQTEDPPSVGIPAVLINEDFRGPVLHHDFTLMGQAGLTNAPHWSQYAPKLGHDKKDHDGAGPSPVQSDARRGAPPYNEDFIHNPGYLQLTDNNHDKVGGVIYNHPLPTSGGLDVTFEMYQYNSTTNGVHAADGIGFFISDGSIDLEAHRAPDGTLVPGAYGGSLGYAQKRDGTVWTQGVIGGYLGVGFDVLGNYIQDEPECRGSRGSRGGTSCPYVAGQRRSPAGAAWGGNVPNTVTLRGPAIGTSGLDGYEYLASTIQMDGETVVKPNGKPVSTLGPDQQLGEPLAQAPEAAARLVRITLTAEPFPEVAVYVAFDAEPETLAASEPLLKYKMTDPMPPTFKFGFTGSTGDMTDVHLIRTLEVSTLRPEARPDFLLEKDAIDFPADECVAGDAAEQAVPVATDRTYGAGDEVCYRFKVTNTGDTELTDITVTDLLIGYEGTVEFLGHPGTDREVAYLYATHVLTQEEVDAAVEGDTGTYTNIAVANTTFGDQPVQREDDASIRVEPTPDEPCTGPTCTTEPPVEPCTGPHCTTEPPVEPCTDVDDCSADLPLPAVGGARDLLGPVALAAAAALIALLATSRRLQQAKPVMVIPPTGPRTPRTRTREKEPAVVKKLTGRIAVPIAAALALLVAPLITGTASAAAAPPPVLIDEDALGSLQIIKLGASSEVPNVEPNGRPVELGKGRIIRIPGVQFRIERLTAYDLKTSEGWLKAKELATAVEGHENELKNLIASEPKDTIATGCTGWGRVQDPKEIDALIDHCADVLEGVHIADGVDIVGGPYATTGELKFENLPVGIYLVSEQKTPANVVPAVPFLVTVPMADPVTPDAWMYDITVYPKNAMPDLSKTVDDKALALSEGASVTYKVELPLPADSMTLALADVLDPRLDFTLDDKHLRIPDFDPLDWVNALASTASGLESVIFANGIKVEFGVLDHDSDPKTDELDRVLRVTYPETIVREVALRTGTLGFEFDAVVKESGEIPNTAHFVVTAPGGTATGKTEVVTKWGGFDVQKQTSNRTALPGAFFNVAKSYEDAVAKNFIFDDAVQSDDQGIVSFTGLRYSYWEDGEEIAPPVDPVSKLPVDVSKLPLDKQDDADTGQIYWLVETEAPLGYELDSTPTPFRVVARSDGVADAEITNVRQPGFELPTIGGNRAIFPILGGLVVVGGVTWLVRSRRVND